MAESTKGLCKYCGKEYKRSGIVRHLSSCKERKAVLENETGKRRCGYFELMITDRYQRDYWLLVEVRDTAKLEDLDEFIRAIWVECCGHLSAFTIDGQQYELMPMEDAFWGEPSKNMNYKLKDVFSVGKIVSYEYDFGTTTELFIKVQSYRTGVWKSDPVTILSRNEPPEILCSHCRKNPAQWVDASRYYYDDDVFWCEDCLRARKTEDTDDEDEYDNEYDDEYLLPVCNSPRMGVCGYEGSSHFPERFEPDKK